MIVAFTATQYSYLWLAWGLVFGFIEVYALRQRKKFASDTYTGGTLSWFVTRFAHSGKWKAIKLAALTIFFAWLNFHFLIEPLLK